MTSEVARARKQYPPELKAEIAQLVLSGKAHIRELSSKRKIPEGNIARWVAQARKVGGNGEPAGRMKEFNASSRAADLINPGPRSKGTAVTLFKGRTRKGGRYTGEQKNVVMKVLQSNKLSVAEISERTGIHQSTLYAWVKELQRAPVQVEVMPAGEDRRSLMQASIHLKKAKAELIAGIRRGVIDDFDNVHLNCLLALNALNVK